MKYGTDAASERTYTRTLLGAIKTTDALTASNELFGSSRETEQPVAPMQNWGSSALPRNEIPHCPQFALSMMRG